MNGTNTEGGEEEWKREYSSCIKLGGQKLDKVQPSNSSVVSKVYFKYPSCRRMWRWGKKKDCEGFFQGLWDYPGAAGSADESPWKYLTVGA